MTMPFQPTGPVSSEIKRVSTSTGPSATTNTVNITLPVAGQYIVTVVGQVQGSINNQAIGTWLVTYPGSAPTSNARKSTQLGTTVISSPSSNAVSALTLSDPTAGGICTATITYSGTLSCAWFYATERIGKFT